MTAQRVAVMVDGENISPVHASLILDESARLGRVDVARVYMTAERPSDWLSTPGFRVMHSTSGRNSADLLLSVDAMELALAGGIEGFVLVSSDGGFVHLAQRLRERGHPVIGLGEPKSTATYRAACSRFVELPMLAKAARPLPVVNSGHLDQKIRAIIEAHGQADSGLRIAELSARMHSIHGVRISTFPERTWRAYLSARPALYQLDARGPDARTRCNRAVCVPGE